MIFYRGCTALITGASAGLGTEFAHQLAPYAARLILVARRLDRLQDLKGELEENHPHLQVFTYALDVTSSADTDTFFQWLNNDSGLRVNVLINNAGLGDHGDFETSDWSRIQSMIDVNITALTRFSHRLIPQLRHVGQGAVLNVSSVAGLLPIPSMAVYAATKAYVNSLSESLRVELRGSGVSVTALCPGPVDTEFGSVAKREVGEGHAAPEIFKVRAEQVVREGLEAAAAGRARVIPGLLVAVVLTVASTIPIYILRHFLKSRN